MSDDPNDWASGQQQPHTHPDAEQHPGNEQLGEPAGDPQPDAGGPAPGSPEADRLSRVDAPQLPSREDEVQRKGVRLPIVLAVIFGVGIVAYLMQGQEFSSGDTGNMGFAEACSGIEVGMPVLDARQRLMASAQYEGMKGPPNIQTDERQLTFSFRPGTSPDLPTRICTLVYAGDGQSVASARFSQR